jgi:hypothetical protein
MLEKTKGAINQWQIQGNYQHWARKRWFSPDTSVSSINKTDPHDTTEILSKVALKTP